MCRSVRVSVLSCVSLCPRMNMMHDSSCLFFSSRVDVYTTYTPSSILFISAHDRRSNGTLRGTWYVGIVSYLYVHALCYSDHEKKIGSISGCVCMSRPLATKGPTTLCKHQSNANIDPSRKKNINQSPPTHPATPFLFRKPTNQPTTKKAAKGFQSGGLFQGLFQGVFHQSNANIDTTQLVTTNPTPPRLPAAARRFFSKPMNQ